MSSSTETHGTPHDLAQVPLCLTARPQWVRWRMAPAEDGRITKVPFDLKTGRRAKSNDPVTWSTFEEVLGVNPEVGADDGVGFVFSTEDPFAGIDLDGCRDPQTGEIANWAWRIIRDLNTFAEVSPSGTGVKLFALGSLPAGAWHKKVRKITPNTAGCCTAKVPAVEMYDRGRFFAVTGRHLAGTPNTVEHRPAELLALQARFADPAQPVSVRRPVNAPSLSPEAVIQKAMQARNGDRFARLWRGDTSDHGGDPSSADLALCGHLAFWTGGDHGAMDSLFRQSGLMRDKWHKRIGGTTYGARTIDKAINGTRKFYRPAGVVG